MTSNAGSTSTLHSVAREVRIGAPPETIWSFLVEPEKVVKWEAAIADLDPRPGGQMRLDMFGDGTVALGEYRDVQPYERLSYTWGWEGDEGHPPGSTLVEITLTPDGADTIVRLEHSQLPTDDAATRHAEGWEHYLARLVVAAPGGDPGPDPWAEGRQPS
jgi:uncharacterized protein YndB with AHSA1/START domain